MVLLMALVVAGSLGSCKQGPSRSYKGKLKKGKPIPCPVKDC